MTNKQIQRLALWLQVGGFVPALLLLFIRPHSTTIFAVAFGIHVVGDVMFFLADRPEQGGNVNFKISNYVKLPAWLQFVAYQFIVGGLLMFAHGKSMTGQRLALIALAIGVGALVYSRLFAISTLFKLPGLLQLGGYAAILFGLLLLTQLESFALVITFLGLGVSQAGYNYDKIYP